MLRLWQRAIAMLRTYGGSANEQPLPTAQPHCCTCLWCDPSRHRLRWCSKHKPAVTITESDDT